MAWLSGWETAKRIPITIDSSKVDSTLTNFPILVKLSASSGINSQDVTDVFDELAAFSKKFAITNSGSTEQYYVEIEKWDNSNEEALLWVKIPSIASGSDTEIYLYYDATHVDNDEYLAESDDTGQLSINIGAEGTEDISHSFAPGAIKDGDTYKMWY